jgi:hypothetical protein
MMTIWLAALFACNPYEEVAATANDTDADTDGAEDSDGMEDSDTGVTLDTAVYEKDATYLIDIRTGTVSPLALGGLVQLYVNVYAMLGTSDPAMPSVDMMLAMSDQAVPPQQDMCNATLDLPPVDYAQAPSFTAQASSLAFMANGYDIILEDVTLSGTFEAPDYDRIVNVDLAGIVDTRPFDQALGGTTGATCELLVTLGVPCQDCGAGDLFCVDTTINDMTAEKVPGPVLVEVSQADVDANAFCF